MIVVTTDKVDGKKTVKTFGLVRGNTIRARHIGRDFLAGLRKIIGGEIKGYTDLMTEAREEAIERMVESATAMGANAVVGVRLATSMIMQQASEVLIYGTAVLVEDE